MSITIKKTFNLKPVFGKQKFGFSPFGKESPKFYNKNQSSLPPELYAINITTISKIINKDLASLDIDFNTINLQTVGIYYQINSGAFIFVETVDYDNSPYTLDLSSIAIIDNDILTVKVILGDTLDTVSFTVG